MGTLFHATELHTLARTLGDYALGVHCQAGSQKHESDKPH